MTNKEQTTAAFFTPVKISLMALMLAGCFGCDDKTPAEEAEDAAVFMCDCMDGSSSQSKLNKCIEEMKKKFNSWGTNEFLETFNEVNDCGITLYYTTTTSKVSGNSPSDPDTGPDD